MTNEQAAALKTRDPVWAWHQLGPDQQSARVPASRLQEYLASRRNTAGGGLAAGVLPQALPLAGCELQDQPRRMGRYPLDDIAQVDEGIDLQVLAGLDERTQDGGRCA